MDPRDYDDEEFADADLSPAPGTRYEDCSFDGCTMSTAGLADVRFFDCSFDRCDFSNLDVVGAQFKGCAFTGCKLIGINWALAQRIEGLRFTRCDLALTSFAQLDLPRTAFADCRLHEADFRETQLVGSGFAGCDLAGALFEGSDLTSADLSSARNYAIDARINTLAKAKVSLPEAMALLEGLGVVLV